MSEEVPAFPRVESERLLIEMPTIADAERVRSFYDRNRDYFRPWEPDHGAFIYTLGFWEHVLPSYLDEYQRGQAVRVILRRKDDLKGPIIGFIHYTQLAGGALMSCWFGCNLDQGHEGKGYMTEAGLVTIKYLFERFGMHRINASYMPTNIRSAKLLRRLGFEVEGFARDYLFINERWRDHMITSVINPAHADLTESFKH